MTREDFEQMWYGSNLPEEQSPANGCILLLALTIAVWTVIGVGIWWAVTR